MAIKEVPYGIKTYYKLMHERAKDNKKKLLEEKQQEIAKERELYEDVKEYIEDYKNNFNINLNDYDEYLQRKYINGRIVKLAKGAFINRSTNYEETSILYDLLKYAKCLERLYELNKSIVLNDKLLKLTFKEYNEILRIYYTQVHRELILNGNGYAITGHVGWICINRCIIRKLRRPLLDFVATNERKKELLAQGKRIYNKEEAEWCKKNGIVYEAEDPKVYKNDEYCYEIPLIDSKLTNGRKLKLETSDYRHSSLRGKTCPQMIEECDRDINKICDLKIDLRTKLNMCDKVDKILYTKYIRNENQTTYKSTTFGGKS